MCNLVQCVSIQRHLIPHLLLFNTDLTANSTVIIPEWSSRAHIFSKAPPSVLVPGNTREYSKSTPGGPCETLKSPVKSTETWKRWLYTDHEKDSCWQWQPKPEGRAPPSVSAGNTHSGWLNVLTAALCGSVNGLRSNAKDWCGDGNKYILGSIWIWKYQMISCSSTGHNDSAHR